MFRALLAVAFCFLVASNGYTQEKEAPIDYKITLVTSVINKAADGSKTVTPFSLSGDPRSPEYQKIKKSEEDKLQQLQAEVSRSSRKSTVWPQTTTVIYREAPTYMRMDNCNRCNDSCSRGCSSSCRSSCSRGCSTSCSTSCSRCSSSCSSCSRSVSSCSSCSSGTGVPAQGFFCNCPDHIARCEARGVNWRTTPCTCPYGSMPGEGGSSGSCCNSR